MQGIHLEGKEVRKKNEVDSKNRLIFSQKGKLSITKCPKNRPKSGTFKNSIFLKK